MNARRLFSLALVLIVLATLTDAAGSAPLAGPCVPGSVYNSACDANQDGQITVTDIQLTAGHWNQNGTFVSDNNHNHLGQTWTGSSNPLKLTGAYAGPDYAPLVLSNTAGDGLGITSAADNGMSVYSAGGAGVFVGSAGGDGVRVNLAGSPSTTAGGPANNGFEVGGAQGFGLWVGRADGAGVYVNSAGNYGMYVGSTSGPGLLVSDAGQIGVYVNSAGSDGVRVNWAGWYGVYVQSAEWDGVYVGLTGSDGVYVAAAGDNGVYASTTQPSHEWGFSTPDKIYAGTALASNGPLMLVAQSGDDGSLETGDLVVVSGTGTTLGESESPPPLVRRAAAGDGSVMGVVYRRFVAEEKVEEVERDGQVERQTDLHTHSTDGPISPGDYLLVVVLGPMQVKAAWGESAITAGMRVTAAAGGSVRPLQTRTVEGMVVSEGAPVIGVAMGPAQDGLVWVMVNPQ